MSAELPDGLYPFIDKRFPLDQLAMIEAPPELETLLRSQAELNGVKLHPGQPIELRCRSAEYPDATFLVYVPTEQDRLHLLVPKDFARGRA
jgi:hypothetical protein